MNFTIILYIFSFLNIFSPDGASPVNSTDIEDWKLVKSKDNIQVFTRKTDNSDFKEIRIIADFKLDVNILMDHLNDPDTYTDWVYKCTEGKALSDIRKKEFYYYTVSDLPFPAKDRDMVVLCKQWIDVHGVIHSSSTSRPNHIPEKEDYIRIPHFDSSWEITPKSDSTVHIDYIALSDPGGSIPTWIVNLAIAAGPLKTMEQLEEVVLNAQ